MNDEYYMEFALNLASSVSGQTSPNPPVGAVVVKNGVLLGFGTHLKAGEAHAEVQALNMAGEKAQGATIYVTLEPCSHHGRTPPCANLVIDKGIKRAIIANADPNEKVAGQGIERLRAAGIDVELGVLQEKAEEINAVFYHYTKTKTPFVTLKSAVSLDGKTATHTGDSKWITGEDARLDVHRYRHTHDAILAGVNTVIVDDPSLTTRLPNGGKNPIRMVLDTTLRTPLDAKILNDLEAETWIFTEKDVSEQKVAPYKEKGKVAIIQLQQLDIDTVLNYMGNNRIMSLFVEGGPTINGSFLEAGRINRLITYIAPKLIGGEHAPTSFSGNGIKTISEAPSLEIKCSEMIGETIKIVAEPRKEA